jgi:hypothetical protein
MRFTPHEVTRVVVADDAECSYAAVADSGGCVSLFRLHGPIAAPAEVGLALSPRYSAVKTPMLLT